MQITAIIVAAGSGIRAAGAAAAPVPKQFQALGGRSVLAWSAAAFLADARVVRLVVVHAPGARGQVLAALGGDVDTRLVLVEGGATRTASVRAGLAAADSAATCVMVHDAARPGLDLSTLDALVTALEAGADGAVPVLPVADALWQADGPELVAARDRTGLVRVQTPQAFRLEALVAAYAALPEGAAAADDAEVARLAGLRVVSVAGSARLDKITWPGDHARMEQTLAPLVPATGTGYDAHRLGPGTHVTLCGVEIAHDGGLVGHSDADVAWHALCDAIYGALCEGDIGKAFPPSDPQWKGAPSRVFLEHAGRRVRDRGGRLVHVDVTVVCEAPRVGPHREAMRAATAEVLGIPVTRVSVKATTTEKMGYTGRGEGIAALASATVLLPDTEG